MKAIFFLLLACLAHGEIKELRVSGEFSPRENAGWFGLEFPIPYVLTMQWDSLAIDEDHDPHIGVYPSEGLPVSLTFGSFHFESRTTEVRISSNENGFYGATVSNDEKFVGPNGFIVDKYFIYVSLLTTQAERYPTDELKWLVDGAQPPSDQAYVYLRGETPEGVPTRIQDNSPDSATITAVVPEPEALWLCLVGLLIFHFSKMRTWSAGR